MRCWIVLWTVGGLPGDSTYRDSSASLQHVFLTFGVTRILTPLRFLGRGRMGPLPPCLIYVAAQYRGSMESVLVTSFLVPIPTTLLLCSRCRSLPFFTVARDAGSLTHLY